MTVALVDAMKGDLALTPEIASCAAPFLKLGDFRGARLLNDESLEDRKLTKLSGGLSDQELTPGADG